MDSQGRLPGSEPGERNCAARECVSLLYVHPGCGGFRPSLP